MINLLRKILNRRNIRKLPTKKKTKEITRYLDSQLKRLRCFAPAWHHNLASSLISSTNLATVFSVLLKTRAFRSFQMDQVTRIASDRDPAAKVELESPDSPWNQSINVSVAFQFVGSKPGEPTHELTSAQILLDSAHSEKRCCAISKLR